MKNMDKGYCLVLSGGGAKGVYHLGVWKALKELDVEVDAFIGTSIGAVVAGLLAQGAENPLAGLSDSITLDSIVALPDEYVEGGKLAVSRGGFSSAKEFFRSFIDNRGLDTSPLKSLLEAKIDEGAIRSSGKDLGVVTINLSNFRPREMFIEEMEGGRVIDYLMASAAFPGFHSPNIEGKKYMDGGLYDNIPYAMARRRGYRRIIVSDISGVGLNRQPAIEGSITVYIKNSINMGGVFDFGREFLRDFEFLGYLDTMRTFGRLKGYSYFVDAAKDAGAEEECRCGARKIHAAQPFPRYMSEDPNTLLKCMECAASILKVPRVALYTYKKLAAAIAERKAADDERVAELHPSSKEKKAHVVAMVREAVKDGSFKGSPYYYWRLLEDFVPKAAEPVSRRALMRFFPELPAGIEYLSTFELGRFATNFAHGRK